MHVDFLSQIFPYIQHYFANRKVATICIFRKCEVQTPWKSFLQYGYKRGFSFYSHTAQIYTAIITQIGDLEEAITEKKMSE